MTTLTGEEFVSKILAGERDFRGITVPAGTNLAAVPAYRDLASACLHEGYQMQPVLLERATLAEISAQGLALPYVRAKEADFSRSQLQGSCFHHGEFRASRWYSTKAHYVNLSYTCLDHAYLKKTTLIGADIQYAHLRSLGGLRVCDGKRGRWNSVSLKGSVLSPEQWKLLKRIIPKGQRALVSIDHDLPELDETTPQKLEALATEILARQGLTSQGLSQKDHDALQERFKKRFFLGAYSQSGESRRKR